MRSTRVNPWPTVKADDPVRTGKSRYPGWKHRPCILRRRRGEPEKRREESWSYDCDE